LIYEYIWYFLFNNLYCYDFWIHVCIVRYCNYVEENQRLDLVICPFSHIMDSLMSFSYLKRAQCCLNNEQLYQSTNSMQKLKITCLYTLTPELRIFVFSLLIRIYKQTFTVISTASNIFKQNGLTSLSWNEMHREAITVKVTLYRRISWEKLHLITYIVNLSDYRNNFLFCHVIMMMLLLFFSHFMFYVFCLNIFCSSKFLFLFFFFGFFFI
jgi:hypothetical protein